ncbi:energy-coupling factor ABC transporter ATP-binding protein [Desulfovibrio sp. OttesenSCG-928-A18]|nr:energy-coupling factor ABC transporter ATP-binding protein [Desulfovibrio sp. OttesenSCG-928-A18]
MNAPLPTPLFALRNIHFTHPGKDAALFSGADLELFAGECVGILGRNGSGKSTLLHIGAGLLTPGEGLVLHKGKPCRTEKDFALARRGIGYLLQNSEDQLFCATVLEDVAFGPYNLGHSAKESEAMAWNMLQELHLEHLAGRNGQRLSGGEQKLAALATILVMGVDLLFLDEPTNNLDAEARELLLTILARYRLPSLIVAHDPALLRSLCTRYCRLENKQLRPCSLERQCGFERECSFEED